MIHTASCSNWELSFGEIGVGWGGVGKRTGRSPVPLRTDAQLSFDSTLGFGIFQSHMMKNNVKTVPIQPLLYATH